MAFGMSMTGLPSALMTPPYTPQQSTPKGREVAYHVANILRGCGPHKHSTRLLPATPSTIGKYKLNNDIGPMTPLKSLINQHYNTPGSSCSIPSKAHYNLVNNNDIANTRARMAREAASLNYVRDDKVINKNGKRAILSTSDTWDGNDGGDWFIGSPINTAALNRIPLHELSPEETAARDRNLRKKIDNNGGFYPGHSAKGRENARMVADDGVLSTEADQALMNGAQENEMVDDMEGLTLDDEVAAARIGERNFNTAVSGLSGMSLGEQTSVAGPSSSAASSSSAAAGDPFVFQGQPQPTDNGTRARGRSTKGGKARKHKGTKRVLRSATAAARYSDLRLPTGQRKTSTGKILPSIPTTASDVTNPATYNIFSGDLFGEPVSESSAGTPDSVIIFHPIYPPQSVLAAPPFLDDDEEPIEEVVEEVSENHPVITLTIMNTLPPTHPNYMPPVPESKKRKYAPYILSKKWMGHWVSWEAFLEIFDAFEYNWKHSNDWGQQSSFKLQRLKNYWLARDSDGCNLLSPFSQPQTPFHPTINHPPKLSSSSPPSHSSPSPPPSPPLHHLFMAAMMAARDDELADAALFTTRTVDDFAFDQFLNITPGPRLLRQTPAVDFAFATPALPSLQWGSNQENQSPPVFRRWMLEATPATLDPRILDIDDDISAAIDTPKTDFKARMTPFAQRLNAQSSRRHPLSIGDERDAVDTPRTNIKARSKLSSQLLALNDSDDTIHTIKTTSRKKPFSQQPNERDDGDSIDTPKASAEMRSKPFSINRTLDSHPGTDDEDEDVTSSGAAIDTLTASILPKLFSQHHHDNSDAIVTPKTDVKARLKPFSQRLNERDAADKSGAINTPKVNVKRSKAFSQPVDGGDNGDQIDALASNSHSRSSSRSFNGDATDNDDIDTPKVNVKRSKPSSQPIDSQHAADNDGASDTPRTQLRPKSPRRLDAADSDTIDTPKAASRQKQRSKRPSEDAADDNDAIDTPKASAKSRPKPFSDDSNEQSPKRRCSAPLTTRHIVRQIVHGIMLQVAAAEASNAPTGTNTTCAETVTAPPEPILTEEEESILELAPLDELPDTVPELQLLLLRAHEKLRGEKLARTRAEETVRYLVVENAFFRSECERRREGISSVHATPVRVREPTATPSAAATMMARPGSSAAKRHPVVSTKTASSTAAATSSSTRARRGDAAASTKSSSTASATARRPASVAAAAPTNAFASSTRARREPAASSHAALSTRPARPQSVMATVRAVPKADAHGAGGSVQKPYASIFSSLDPTTSPKHTATTASNATERWESVATLPSKNGRAAAAAQTHWDAPRQGRGVDVAMAVAGGHGVTRAERSALTAPTVRPSSRATGRTALTARPANRAVVGLSEEEYGKGRR
ncbi:hypothetical protein Dda_2127 [Drechslerella dactyloides]|uniref:Uncharacterized protein n=1 Tax=Drechslerella dactyloides TaxID=74499 RepID=A0AAD6J2Y4_DREDA|nr:hypothetical protein Dda_2127 [Drechslerella dactyloides]